MSNASVKTWIQQMESGELKSKTIKILKYIKDNQFTDIDLIRQELSISHQSVTAIVSNLMDEGMVDFVGERQRDGTTYSVLKYIDSQFQQAILKERRIKEKYRLWLEKGLTDYRHLMSTPLIMSLTMEQSI